VLEGSVRKAGNRLRVTAQLIEAADGYHLWSERYDREMDDVFAVQDEIASAITRKLQVTLGADQASGGTRRGTNNLEAYDLYLRGRFHWDQRGDGLLKGLQFFEKALELDPAYALAHTGVADVNSMWAFYGVKPSGEVLPKAKDAATKALAIDDASAEAHTALAVTALQGWDFAAAETGFRRAIELDPRYPLTRYWYGFHVLQLIHGRAEEGIEQCRLGLEADPLGTFPQVMMGIALTVGERYDEAAPHLERAVARDPSNFFTHRTVGMHAMLQGRYDDAIHSFDKSLELSGHPWPEAERGAALAFSGREDEARKVQGKMERRAEVGYLSPFALSMVPAALGQTDRALSHLERGCEVRDPVLYVLGHWPLFKPLRGHPRFESILRRVGLPETPSP
jgi:tetratricopeptide (TPR) repeat protein